MKLFILTKRTVLSLFVCLFAAVLAGVISLGALSNTVQIAAEPREIPIYCLETEEKKVALSFDAAWGNEQTQQLLDILDQHGVKTTFFLVGDWVDNYPDSVKEIAARGHDVENHSNTHPYMSQLSETKMKEEINSCNEKIEAITGNAPTLFRAPYGDYNNSVVKSVKSCDMYCIQWDVDSLDWKDPSPQQIVKTVTDKLKCGSIILMHNGAANTPEALPMVIEAIKEQGYEIVPISELLPQGDYTTDANGAMRPATGETQPADVPPSVE